MAPSWIQRPPLPLEGEKYNLANQLPQVLKNASKSILPCTRHGVPHTHNGRHFSSDNVTAQEITAQEAFPHAAHFKTQTK
jgi:hypothetical protein